MKSALNARQKPRRVGGTADQALVREMNLSIVLNALRDYSPLSRASLAALTGLNKTTVSSLVRQLVGAGFVSEIGSGRTEDLGRPGVLLDLDPKAGCIVGVEIDVDFISVIIADFAAGIVWRRWEDTSHNQDQQTVTAKAIEIIKEGIDATKHEYRRVLGLGLGIPGLVDISSGTLIFAPNLRWSDVPLGRMMRDTFDFPIFVDNDNNMAALGESYFGVARGARSVLFIGAGVGVGGGIVLNGELMSGITGFSGEIGHMTMAQGDLLCNCGNRGCWETQVSQNAVFRRVRESIAAGLRSSLMRATSGDLDALTVPIVVEAAQHKDKVALRALEDTAVDLGVGIANLVNVLNPEVVVFGGSLSLASEFLMPVIERTIREHALQWSVAAVRLAVATHGSDAAAMGGIAAVYHRVLSQPSESMYDVTHTSADKLRQGAPAR